MKRKIYVAIIISFLMIFENINVAYCSGLDDFFGLNAVYTGLHNAITQQEKANAISDWIHKNSQSVGFLFDFVSPQRPLSFLIDICPQSWIDNLSSDPSEEEIYDAVIEGITSGQTVSNNNVVNDNSVNVFIKNFANYYISNNISYAYSFSKDDFVNLMNLQEYNILVSFLNDNENEKYIFLYRPRNNPYVLFTLDKDEFPYFYLRGINTTDIYRPDNVVYGRCTNAYDSSAIDSDDVSCYQFDSANNELASITPVFNGNYVCGVLDLDITKSSPSRNDVLYLVTSSGGEPVRYKYGLATAQDILYQPYYYNNSVWQDFSTHTGDYTIDNSNVNTVTYNDTKNYIDSFNTTNGYPPTPQDININIENQNNNNNNNNGGSGGGSGGSGDDSGGSGSGIVSILTALGKAIADLITGIAAFLAEVVGGLVEAITGLLDTLTDLITNFTESIPNIFSPLLGWLFDGLPEEFTAIILLGLTACVIASIIKILRG